ncbi:hypothetical protein ACSBR1_026139 [Camellia fascicularis]
MKEEGWSSKAVSRSGSGGGIRVMVAFVSFVLENGLKLRVLGNRNRTRSFLTFRSLANGTIVAVKILSDFSNKRIEEQFMVEVSAIGRIHHLNLVRFYGLCFDKHLRAMVYEYIANGSPDKYLFDENNFIAFEKLHEIAKGTVRGIAYLLEECQQRIIHYDMKLGNILLDIKFTPKVADFGLAKLHNRENTHVTMTRGKGTPGHAAPELWMPFPTTHKCDVYSFGMLLFEIIRRRRNLNINLPENQE